MTKSADFDQMVCESCVAFNSLNKILFMVVKMPFLHLYFVFNFQSVLKVDLHTED